MFFVDVYSNSPVSFDWTVLGLCIFNGPLWAKFNLLSEFFRNRNGQWHCFIEWVFYLMFKKGIATCTTLLLFSASHCKRKLLLVFASKHMDGVLLVCILDRTFNARYTAFCCLINSAKEMAPRKTKKKATATNCSYKNKQEQLLPQYT